MDQVNVKAIFSLIVTINNKRETIERESVTVNVNISMNVLQKTKLYFHNHNGDQYIWKTKEQETFAGRCLTWWLVAECCVTFTGQNISSATRVIVM